VIAIRLDLDKVYKAEGLDSRERCEKVRRTRQAPLGWYMSYGAARIIAESARLEVNTLMSKQELAGGLAVDELH
jgi:hypothetical protein